MQQTLQTDSDPWQPSPKQKHFFKKSADICDFATWYTYSRHLYNPSWHDNMDPVAYDEYVTYFRERNQQLYYICTFCGFNYPGYEPDLFGYSFLTARAGEIKQLAETALYLAWHRGEFEFEGAGGADFYLQSKDVSVAENIACPPLRQLVWQRASALAIADNLYFQV